MYLLNTIPIHTYNVDNDIYTFAYIGIPTSSSRCANSMDSSHHPSLSVIILGKFSRRHPVFAQS